MSLCKWQENRRLKKSFKTAFKTFPFKTSSFKLFLVLKVNSLAVTPCKHMKGQFELYPNMLNGIRGMTCFTSGVVGTQDTHPSEKYSCF